MNRRNFLSVLACLPGLGWVKPKRVWRGPSKPIQAEITIYRWTGNGGDLWFDNPDNWHPQGVPQSAGEIACSELESGYLLMGRTAQASANMTVD